jgi:hypothetical protein
MGYPITGSTATVVSVSASTDVKYLFDVLKISEVGVNLEADEFDISELSGSGSAVERLSGLRSGTMSFSGFYPKSAPKMGNTGLVTYGGSAIAWVADWSMEVDFGETEITSFAATGPTVKQYIPNGIFTWGGSFNAHALNDTAVTLPTSAGSTGTAAIFQIFKGATNNHTLSGSILLKSLGHAVRKADKQVLAYSYSGSGALTETQGDTYDPLRVDPGSSAPGTATAWGVPSYDLSASPMTPSVVVKTYEAGGTDREYTFSAFLKSLSISVSPGNPIAVSGTLRIFNAVSNT